MAKSNKFEAGNIFRVKLLNGMYMFGHIVFFVPRRNKRKYQELNPESYLRGFLSNCILVDIYSQISHSEVLESKEVFFKGVFLSSSDLSTYDDMIIVAEDEIVNIEKVEFPETIGANLENGFFLQRGELQFKLGVITKNMQDELAKSPSSSFKDVYSVADDVLFLQNRESEMQRKYYDGYKHTPSDLKNHPELRAEIYKIIGENSTLSYYDLSLKHGFDLGRFYLK